MDNKQKRDFVLENAVKLPVQLMKLPVDVMVSSMETITKTMQEIQVQSQPDHNLNDGTENEDTSSVANVFKHSVAPLFGMFKIPREVLMSSIDTISRSVKSIREQGEQPEPVNEGFEVNEFDRGGVPLTEQEAKVEQETLVVTDAEGILSKTVWQIGRPGRSEFNQKWAATFDYEVGSDIDPINSPRIPHLITYQSGSKPAGATEVLNIHFALDRNYSHGELALIYDRWGGEKDFVSVDGKLLSPVGGAGEGIFKHVELSLKKISSGNHVITITCSGESEAAEHRIDYLKLVSVEETDRSN